MKVIPVTYLMKVFSEMRHEQYIIYLCFANIRLHWNQNFTISFSARDAFLE